MPSPFQIAAADAAAAANEWYGEEFTLEPRVKPDVNGRSIADTSRPVEAFRAVFIARGSILHAKGRNRADSSTSGIVADTAYLRILVPTLSAEPRLDDHLTRIGTGERFRAAAGLSRQFGGLHLKLTEMQA